MGGDVRYIGGGYEAACRLSGSEPFCTGYRLRTRAGHSLRPVPFARDEARLDAAGRSFCGGLAAREGCRWLHAWVPGHGRCDYGDWISCQASRALGLWMQVLDTGCGGGGLMANPARYS